MKNNSGIKSPLASVFILISFLSVLSGCAGLKESDSARNVRGPGQEYSALRMMITEEMKLKKITGLSIAVADSGGILWSEGFGTADKREKRAFTADTVSNIGSVSKIITATAVMKLVETGKVDLDDPVSLYIPEFNPRDIELINSEPTVRMLLNHQSGLESDGFNDFFLGYKQPDDYRHSYRRAIEAVNKCGVVRAPDTIFSYCNLGYSILGCIIERIHGTDFQTAVSELVFQPLGMNSSSFILDDAPAGRLAMGYTGGKPSPLPYIRDMPAGSLNSSADDMGMFLTDILASFKNDKGLLSRQSLETMFRPSNAGVANDLDFRIGLGWWIIKLPSLPGEYILGHGGDLPPYHALVMVLPERDLAVFIMVNSVNGVGCFSLADIASNVASSFAELMKQPPVKPAAPASPAVPFPESEMKVLPGYYASSSGLVEVKRKGDAMKIFAFNRWFDLNYHEDGSLTLGMKLLGLIPLKLPVFEEMSISTEDVAGTQSLNLRLQGIFLGPCIKIEPAAIEPAWMNRRGTYIAARPEVMPQYTGFRIDSDDSSGFLCLYVQSSDGWSKFPLQTEGESRARLLGIGRGLGGSITAETADNGETLSFLNFELKRKY